LRMHSPKNGKNDGKGDGSEHSKRVTGLRFSPSFAAS
jgi:hypothetical protein